MIVTNEFPPDKVAGTAMATDALARKLVERNYEILVAVVRSDRQTAGTSAPADHIKRFSGKPVKGTGWIVRLFFVFNQARRFKPNVIQGQALSCGLLASITGRLLGIPAITYAQGQDFYQARKWQKATEIRFSCLLPDAVAAVSDDLGRRLEKEYRLPDVNKIPHGFEARTDDRFKKILEEKNPQISKGPIVICVGRLEAVKGQDILLTAWRKIAQQHPDAALWLVGDGSLKHNLQQMSQYLGIDSSVTFWGNLAHPKVMALMETADLLVLPSRSEAFGIVLLEAMSKGLPVVATAVDGVKEVLPVDGDVYPVLRPTPELFSRAIERALEEDRRPSRKNRAWAEQYNWDKVVERFERLYVQVLRSKKLP